MLVPTDEPFRALSADELAETLRGGLFKTFRLHRTDHYLIFYQDSRDPEEVTASLRFAEASGKLLESLYRRLLDTFRKHEVPVHETEFPLVAVIYRTEKDFRAGKSIDPEVQAYYEIYTNKIYFYERSDKDEAAPEISSMRKPQTVAHEGTHQILQNIGVHARLAEWPIWLIEGLAEYCATPSSTRKGKPVWDGPGKINGLHMATIRELEDPVSLAFRGSGGGARPVIREPGKPLVESLIRKTRLTPTEYALAWAMTHYLAVKREDDFVRYLKAMSQIQPLAPRTPEDQVRDFQQVFGADLVALDRSIDAYLRKLSKQRGYDPMPYYAVIFEQPMPTGIRRAALVSQSPQMIRQTIEALRSPQGAEPSWRAIPHSTKARAMLAIDEWLHGY
jgi:hypothetical protein